MGKVLLHMAYPLWRKNSLIGFARAKELQDQGEEVCVTYCAARAGTCVCNMTGNPLVCQMCRLTSRRTANKYGLRAIPLAGSDLEKIDRDEVPVALSDRKELVEGVASGLISKFRLLTRDIRRHRILRIIKRRSFATSVRLFRHMRAITMRESPDRLEVFNGRHACSKFVILVAKSMKLPFNTLEVTAKKRPILHLGHAAHNRDGIQARIRSQPIDMKLASNFYEGRQRPRDNKFAKAQTQTFQPPELGRYDRMASIFLSSQDEFAALGKDWVSSFDEDHEVVLRLCKAFPQTLFCIRFHPNQAEIRSDVIGPFRPLEQLPNTRLYYPRDAANTYHLIDVSEIVVVFNSTVAVEACWASKPVVMIGPSFYDQLDVAYTPRDEGGLHELLRQPSLPPKPKENAARLAHYMLKDGNDMRYVRVVGGKMAAAGPRRSLPWVSIVARNIDTLSCEIVKPLWSPSRPMPSRDQSP